MRSSKVAKKSPKKCQKMSQKKSQKSAKKVPTKRAKKSAKKEPKNVSIFETFLVPKTQQKGYTLLTRFDVGVTTTAISDEKIFFGKILFGFEENDVFLDIGAIVVDIVVFI